MQTTDVAAGCRFGKLLVVEPAPKKRGYRRWKCRCDCGMEKPITASALVSGNAKSCGCSRHVCKVIHPGDRFGRLLAVRFVERKGAARAPYWLFNCDCGKEKLLNAYRIIHGNAKSCGCFRRDKARSLKGTKRPGSDGGVRSLFTCYKCRAKDRGIEFSLTYEEFKENVTKPCAYCGKLRTLSPNISNRNRLLSGIDRVDSCVGYVLGNCVPSCTRCNIAKARMSFSEFKTWIFDVYQHLLK